MTLLVRHFYTCVIILLLTTPFLVGQGLWRPYQSTDNELRARERDLPGQFTCWQLDTAALLSLLSTHTQTLKSDQNPGFQVTIPVRDAFFSFDIFPHPVMMPGLEARFPAINTYSGINPSKPGQRLYLSLTPHGIHFTVIAPGAKPFYIDPMQEGHYIAYGRDDLSSPHHDWNCHQHEAQNEASAAYLSGSNTAMIVYRLALACTGEYGQFHGGTTESALSAMVTAVTRINAITESEAGIRFILVEDNDLLIHTDPDTDPFDDGNIQAMIAQNQTLCDQKIGTGGYDIGHVLGTSGGGLANIGSVCKPATKARGATAASMPQGDPFYIDLLAHEIGHQLGANHTFNNSCSNNRNDLTAWEPGSGSTIMGYAGVCPPDIQLHSDPYFHGGSLHEIRQYTRQGAGSVCGMPTDTMLPNPLVVAGKNRFIPHATPFVLTAEGTGTTPESQYTYTWEQFDAQVTTMPPSGGASSGPLFRSLPPDTVPFRYFPDLKAVLTQSPTPWEVLPTVNRSLQFRVTVREIGTQGVGWNQDGLTLWSVADAGPFVVTTPNASLEWTIGDTVAVSWDVAMTDIAPVDCPFVDILLSTDGGKTWPHVLADRVPNEGTFTLIVPDVPSGNCRMMIRGHDHVFFDVSDVDFTIKIPDVPSFIAAGDTDRASLCKEGNGEVDFSIFLKSFSPQPELLQYHWTGPDGLTGPANASMSITGEDTLTFTVQLQGALIPGMYPCTLHIDNGIITRSLVYHITIESPVLTIPFPVYPLNGEDGVSVKTRFEWTPSPETGFTRLLIGYSPNMDAQILLDTIVAGSSMEISLEPGTVYYWRLEAGNSCGISLTGPISVFRTHFATCKNIGTEDLPITIPSGSAFTHNSIAQYPDAGLVTDVAVYVSLQHSALQQLTLRLQHFDGTQRVLVAKTCSGQADIEALFSDEGEVFACSAFSPAIQGHLQAQSGSFSVFEGLQAKGVWTLRLIDDQVGHGGSLNGWYARVCTRPDTLPTFPQSILEGPVPVPYLGSAPVTSTHWLLKGKSLQPLVYTLLEQGQAGIVSLNGLTLEVGMTITSQDIEDGNVAYTHDGSDRLNDTIHWAVLDPVNRGWLPMIAMPVRIDTAFTVEVIVDTPVSCYGSNNGRLSATLTGGKAPIEYRLSSVSDWQSESYFDGLSAGEYTIAARDANGFESYSMPITVTQPDSLVLILEWIGDSLYFQTQGGTAPYRYVVNEDTVDLEVLFLTESGEYTVQVIDRAGCVAAAGILADLLTGEVLSEDPLCAGEANGMILIQASGGAPPYAYSIDGVTWQGWASFNGLTAGNYTVWVRDTIPVTRLLGELTLSAPDVLVISAQQVGDSLAAIQATGGTPPYVYGLEGTWQDSTMFAGLPDGTYLFFVRDANGCLDSVTLTIQTTALTDPTDWPGVQLSVFPHPLTTGSVLHLVHQNTHPVILYLSDILGHQLYHCKVLPGELFALHLGDWIPNAGMMMITVVSQSQTRTMLLVRK